MVPIAAAGTAAHNHSASCLLPWPPFEAGGLDGGTLAVLLPAATFRPGGGALLGGGFLAAAVPFTLAMNSGAGCAATTVTSASRSKRLNSTCQQGVFVLYTRNTQPDAP